MSNTAKFPSVGGAPSNDATRVIDEPVQAASSADDSGEYGKGRYKARSAKRASADEIAFGIICLLLIIAILCYQHFFM